MLQNFGSDQKIQFDALIRQEAKGLKEDWNNKKVQQKNFVLTKESRAVRVSGETITTYRNIQMEHDGHEIILPKVSQLNSQSSVLFPQSQDDSIEEFILPFISSDFKGNQITSHH